MRSPPVFHSIVGFVSVASALSPVAGPYHIPSCPSSETLPLRSSTPLLLPFALPLLLVPLTALTTPLPCLPHYPLPPFLPQLSTQTDTPPLTHVHHAAPSTCPTPRAPCSCCSSRRRALTLSLYHPSYPIRSFSHPSHLRRPGRVVLSLRNRTNRTGTER
jgi:hypothetical protein